MGAFDPESRRAENSAKDLAALRGYAPTPEGPLTLDAAVALALRHNLSARIQELEARVRDESRAAAMLRMLPSLELSADQSWRSEDRAASSQSYTSGQQSLEPSISSERDSFEAKARLLWSALDFGLSYIRARQAKLEVAQAEAERQRVRQNLILDVTRAWWRARVALDGLVGARDALKRVRAREETVRRQTREKTIAEAAGLEQTYRLLTLQEQLGAFEAESRAAQAELAILLGLLPGSPLELAAPEAEVAIAAPEPAVLEATALRCRPELRRLDLEEAIQVEEVRKALLRMFPNARLFGSREYDANPFLVTHQWYTVGLQASWDLFSLPAQAKERRAQRRQVDVVVGRRLAMAMAVLSQVHIAAADVRETRRQLELATALRDVQQSRLEEARKRQREGEADEGSVLELEVASLQEQARYQARRAASVLALARLCNAAGVESPAALAREVEPAGRPMAEVNVAEDPGRNAQPPADADRIIPQPVVVAPAAQGDSRP